jgi:hypothetical protein
MHALSKFALENNILAGNVMCDTHLLASVLKMEREREGGGLARLRVKTFCIGYNVPQDLSKFRRLVVSLT